MVQLPHYGLHDVWQASMGYFWQARWPCARARSKLDPRANKGRFQEAALAVENHLGTTPVNEPRTLTGHENTQTVQKRCRTETDPSLRHRSPLVSGSKPRSLGQQLQDKVAEVGLVIERSHSGDPTLLPLLQGSLAALATTDILHVLPSMRQRVVNLCVCAREHACKSMHFRGSRASEAGGKTWAAGKESETEGHQASTHQSCNYRHRRCMQLDTARHHVGKELAEIGQAC